jgi:hypothetical protein
MLWSNVLPPELVGDALRRLNLVECRPGYSGEGFWLDDWGWYVHTLSFVGLHKQDGGTEILVWSQRRLLWLGPSVVWWPLEQALVVAWEEERGFDLWSPVGREQMAKVLTAHVREKRADRVTARDAFEVYGRMGAGPACIHFNRIVAAVFGGLLAEAHAELRSWYDPDLARGQFRGSHTQRVGDLAVRQAGRNEP